MFKKLTLVAMFAVAPLAQAATFTTLTLPTLNADLRTPVGGDVFIPLFPGTHTWNGVPFQLAVDAHENTSFFIGVLDIPVGVYGVTQAYTLINSAYGAFGSNNGSVEFFGSGGATYKVDLIQGTNIRDYYQNVFNNTIDGVNAVEAFAQDRSRLDEQIYNLPAAFATQTLDTIRFTSLDMGTAGQPFITAATVAVVPEPETYALMLAGLGLLGWVQRRRQA